MLPKIKAQRMNGDELRRLFLCSATRLCRVARVRMHRGREIENAYEEIVPADDRAVNLLLVHVRSDSAI